MKRVMKPIAMVAWFTEDGVITPMRFRIQSRDSENLTIRVDQVNKINTEKTAGNIMKVYDCQSIIEGLEKPYQLKYEIETSKWYLHKI